MSSRKNSVGACEAGGMRSWQPRHHQMAIVGERPVTNLVPESEVRPEVLKWHRLRHVDLAECGGHILSQRGGYVLAQRGGHALAQREGWRCRGWSGAGGT